MRRARTEPKRDAPGLAKCGPLERDLQGWILAALGEQAYEMRRDDAGSIKPAAINAWVRDGCVFYRNNTGATKTEGGGFIKFGLGRGSPDIIGCVRGRAVAVEVKAPRGRLSAEQERWRDRWVAAGGSYAVVRSPMEANRWLQSIIKEQETVE